MGLREDLVKQGNWIFRWRSYLPLAMILLVPLAMKNFDYLGHSQKWDLVWEMICMSISLMGLFIRFVTIGYTPKGTSGTNTERQIADSLNQTGMYSIVRHPLYLGNFIIWFAVAAFFRLWWVSLIVILVFWLYYERIMFAEEEFLREKFGDSYLTWANETPAIIPDLRKWRSPRMSFSIKKAIKNEYKSCYFIIIAFFLLEIFGDFFSEAKFNLDRTWVMVLFISTIFYLFIRTLKKKTKILETERG